MKKSVKIITAIILAVALLIPSTLAFAYEAGDTVQWKNTYEDYGEEPSTAIFYPVYKGEITTGRTEHFNLGDADDVAFLFTAEEAGYYLFSGSNDPLVSEKIVSGKPENFKECFYLYSDTDYEYSTNYTVFYFEEGEQQFVMIRYDEDAEDNRGCINIDFAGKVEDIEAAEEKTYVIDGNIWSCYQEEPEINLEWIIDDFFIITFSDYDEEELYDSYIYAKSTEELAEGENTVTLCEAGFEKEVKINCFDVDSHIANIRKTDNTIYNDYEGYYYENNSDLTVTFADKTTKTVAEGEIFEISGIYFCVDSEYDCWYDEETEEEVVCYNNSLRYAYDKDDFFCICKICRQEATAESLSFFENFSILIEDIRNEISEYFGYLVSGENPSFTSYLSYIRWHIYWFIQAI